MNNNVEKQSGIRYTTNNKGVMRLELASTSTVFDVLAAICSLLTKEEERRCAIKWETATKSQITRFLRKYKNFLEVILNCSMQEYTFNNDEIELINDVLDSLSGCVNGQ